MLFLSSYNSIILCGAITFSYILAVIILGLHKGMGPDIYKRILEHPAELTPEAQFYIAVDPAFGSSKFGIMLVCIIDDIPIISEYVNSLNPQLSDTWHVDEPFVKMHGG